MNLFENGIKLPMIHDYQTGKPSVTLTFSIITFVLSCYTIVQFYGTKISLMPCLVSIGFWFLATVLYIIRKINKASFDIDDKKISLEN